MKKLLVILLSLGLLVAFGATASAADVKFGGSYYIVGVYDNNQTLRDKDATNSRAFFYQRIRIEPVFQIAEGLTFTTRFDAMEKQWGQTDWRTGFDDKASSRREQADNFNPKIQESIEFERGYVGFATAIGVVQAGYMSSGKWGTDFGDDEQSRPRARIDTKMGPMQFGVVYEKEFEADTSSKPGYAGKVDADNDTLSLYGLYNFPGGSAGVLYKYFDRSATRVTANYRGNWHALLPTFKVTFGPVYMEGEAFFAFGKYAEFDNGVPDKDIRGLGAYLKVQANLGPAYFGAKAGYSQGDSDPADNVVKMGPQSQDLAYGLILGNDDLQTWNGSNGNGNVVLNAANPGFDSGKANSIMASGFGGFNPTPKLNVEAVLVYGQLDKKPAGYDSKKLGWEFDLTAKYKIYDNLTYMVGAGYLWTGDAFKGTSSANSVDNDYLLMNRLSLSF
jgi:hypothetical protein